MDLRTLQAGPAPLKFTAMREWALEHDTRVCDECRMPLGYCEANRAQELWERAPEEWELHRHFVPLHVRERARRALEMLGLPPGDYRSTAERYAATQLPYDCPMTELQIAAYIATLIMEPGYERWIERAARERDAYYSRLESERRFTSFTLAGNPVRPLPALWLDPSNF